MRNGLCILFLLWLTGCATTAGQDWRRFSDSSLKEWLDEQAIPGLTQTLSQHPRFKSETIRVAVLDGTEVAGRSNAFATAIRNTLYSALLQEPGLAIVRIDGPAQCASAALDGYYLAVVMSPSGSRSASVQLELYDIVEQQWISGFGYQWRGDLSSKQRDAFQRPVVAETARGLRVLPFTADQSDLLAARLAADLACQLKRQGDDEQVVRPVKDRAAGLIAGNLAGKHQIPVAADGVLELETRVHKVDDQLYQVWAILTPDSTLTDMSAITSSAYATRPLLKATNTRHSSPTTVVPAVKPKVVVQPQRPQALLSQLDVVAAVREADCNDSLWRHKTRNLGTRPVVAAEACFGLLFERHRQANFYVIRHRVDSRLQRMYPSRCSRSIEAVAVRFPANKNGMSWDARSGMETIYVIAARGKRANARIDRLVARLPDACGADQAVTQAVTQPDPKWLNDIDAAVTTFGDDVAWQAVRVYHQPRSETQRVSEITGAKR